MIRQYRDGVIPAGSDEVIAALVRRRRAALAHPSRIGGEDLEPVGYVEHGHAARFDPARGVRMGPTARRPEDRRDRRRVPAYRLEGRN